MTIQLSEHFTYKKIFRFALPSIVMMVFTSIYGVVDGTFVSNFVGKTPFAAVNLVWPFLMILGAFGFMIGTGGSALVAKTLGENKKEDANRYFTMLITLVVILGILLTIFGLIVVRPLSYALGARGQMLEDCVTYGRTLMIFNTAFMLQSVFQSLFITAEKPRLGLIMTVAAGLTNMVLDALFIAVFKWGLVGAALASGLSQCIGGILPLIYFLSSKNDTPLKFVKTKMEGKVLLKACANGASELMTTVSSSLVSMLYNFQLMRLAGQNGIAAYGAVMYVEFAFIAVFIGYSIGTAPIVSYHYGSENHNEVKNMLQKSFKIMSILGITMMVLAQILASPLAKVFVGYDKQLFDMTVHGFRLFSFYFILAGINIYASSFFTALNNGMISAIISFSRTLGFETLAVIILPIFLQLDGVWLAITVAEICAFVISISFLIAKKEKYHYA
ncbi:putative efflux protein, MATE family [Intestinibacter bartlettii DSM 16795]|jgi:putative MATE family efflux protein|uniref:MATE family efflux transporter n=2 Tax=Intestinibacter bartlettii TaxID=261299 RepID=UPI00016311E9|nr:MATE family efflux transporter [Intestinibacter bartlettii]EDQ95735.1 MATE efflux family protein [Intestinibacter bartlettii DSM 16795]MDU2163473.1 MATE family efflux transporter [Intestinibacter bartlettii]MEE0617279.1 MATE family efflux transporter [Intestinibacter bartlettii]UWO80489.1 MATE family efflux transporter [Intestinibacter bartlettii]SKA58975.1 putative efflux protein, MATE family [Intestinibacter bartlettii DSM 16795]